METLRWKHSEVVHYAQKRSSQVFSLFDCTGNPASGLGVSGIIWAKNRLGGHQPRVEGSCFGGQVR